MGMLSCSAHRHYWEPRLPFVSPSWPPLPSLPPRPKLTPTLSSSLDTGLPTLPPSSTMSPSARSSPRPSLSARDAMLSLTAPPKPLLSASTSPDTRSPHALTSSMLSPMPTMARGRLRPTPAPRRRPLPGPRHRHRDHQALCARRPHHRGHHPRCYQVCPQERVRRCRGYRSQDRLWRRRCC